MIDPTIILLKPSNILRCAQDISGGSGITEETTEVQKKINIKSL